MLKIPRRKNRIEDTLRRLFATERIEISTRIKSWKRVDIQPQIFKNPCATIPRTGADFIPGAKFIRREYPAGFLSRCSRSLNDGGRGRKKGAKSAFVCGLRNRKKRQFTLFLALPPFPPVLLLLLSPDVRAPVSVCTYAALGSLDFLVKPATESEPRPMAVVAWRSRCELYMRIYPNTILSAVYPFLARRAPVVFLALPSRYIQSATTHSFPRPLLVCSYVFSRLRPVTSRSLETVIYILREREKREDFNLNDKSSILRFDTLRET